MNFSADQSVLAWLSVCSGLDRRMQVAVLRRAGSPEALFGNFEKICREVIQRPSGGVYKEGNLHSRERERDALCAHLAERGCFIVAPTDGDYPEGLKAADPPLVLFGKGRRELLARRKFCIVGSRAIPPWAEKAGVRTAEELSGKFTIVTGLAEGGDLAAIRGALGSGNLISVLPCGLDECYPAAHASYKEEIGRKGLLLSECPPSEKVHKFSFHARNRILAGLSEGVLVLSAGVRSGALITANCALEYGREVFAFPHSLGSASGEGCNELIKRGAYLATGAKDIFDCFGMSALPKRQIPLSPGEERALSALRQGDELHVSVLSEETGMQTQELLAVLSALELKGLAVKCGGNRYKSI